MYAVVMRSRACLAALMLLLLGSVPALCQDSSARIALFIGNSRYLEARSTLASTIPDTRMLADVFRRGNFAVEEKENMRRDEMQRALRAFIAQVRQGTTAVFYFNGLGIQSGGKTFLLPVDAQISTEDSIQQQAVNLDATVGEIHRRGARTLIVMIDASRRNRYESHIRTVSSGLAPINAPDGTLVLYSASPGKVVEVSPGGNDVFSNELVAQLRAPDQAIEDAFNRTRFAVARSTHNEQVPWVATTLVDEFYLSRKPGPESSPAISALPPPQPPPNASKPNPNSNASPGGPRGPTAAESASAWNAIKDTTTPEVLRAFLEVHGQSIYAAEARTRLSSLEKRLHSQAEVQPGANPKSGAPTRESAPARSPSRETATRPHDRFSDCAGCPEMVVVPAGSFTMGSPKTELGRLENEGPQRTVTIRRPFAVSIYAITFDEWDACVADRGCDGYTPPSTSGPRGRYPVTNVSWDDANAFVAWLSRKTHKRYRLLSESEREYVTRAGTSSPFWFGATISTEMANYDGSRAYGSGRQGEARKHTLPVQFFAANSFGLYQVHGNIYEWTEDCWRPSYANAPDDGSPVRVDGCPAHTIRGGSFSDPPDALRSAARSGFPTNGRSARIGFRVARQL